MIAAKDKGGFEYAASDGMVESQPKLVPLAVSQPANTRRQSLKLYAFLRKLYPTTEMLVVREHLQYQLIGARNVGGFTRQCCPPERAFAFAEQGTNIGGHKTREIVSVFEPLFVGEGADIVSIVERNCAEVLQIEHAFDMFRHGGHGS